MNAILCLHVLFCSKELKPFESVVQNNAAMYPRHGES